MSILGGGGAGGLIAFFFSLPLPCYGEATPAVVYNIFDTFKTKSLQKPLN